MYIYCVDDHLIHLERIREIIVNICRECKLSEYEIIECHDGADLLEKAVKKPPRLITLDINMPVMDGLSALVKIRQLFPAAKVVMVSSENESALKRLASKTDNFNIDEQKKHQLLSRVIDRIKNGVHEQGKINSVLEACINLGMDPLKVSKELGANGYITKPINTEAAHDLLNGLIFFNREYKVT